MYVLISAYGASKSSYFSYPRMKGELEEAVVALGFDRTVLVRPGMIMGDRRKEDIGAAEYAVRRLMELIGAVSGGVRDAMAQDADAIAAAAVEAGLRCLDGNAQEGRVWTIQGKEILEFSNGPKAT